MAKKVLIVYGTRFGATKGTSEEIARVLGGEGCDVRVVNAKEEKVSDISGYDLIVVASGMMINRWTKEPEKFLKKFHKELAQKKVALFVSSGAQTMQAMNKDEDGAQTMEKTRQKYLEEKAAKYKLKPVALGLFGGVWDFNNMPWWAKKFADMVRPEIEAAGHKETEPGVYDTRDWDAIRSWAKELAAQL
jgi:menaquinone-dependent protoporphyrinogen IX oxidase